MEKSPRELAEERVIMAGEYARLSELLFEVMKERAQWWQEHSQEHKSDMKATRAWELTEGGIKEMEYRMKLRSKEKQMSAISTMLRVLEGEANLKY